MTQETPIQDKDEYGFPTESEAQTGTPTEYSQDWVWKDTDDVDIGEQSYRNMKRDILYLQDTFLNGREEKQTKIQDWHNNRYAVKLKKNYTPPEVDDDVLHTSMDWNEAQAFLEAKAGDFQ